MQTGIQELLAAHATMITLRSQRTAVLLEKGTALPFYQDLTENAEQ